jgi:hypothetical protein
VRCELCAEADASVFVYIDMRRRPGLHKELNSCDDCTSDATRALEGDDETTGFAYVERWAA